MEGSSETEYYLLSLREEIRRYLRDISNELFSLVKIPLKFQVEDLVITKAVFRLLKHNGIGCCTILP
jgi:hypothetical protein